jgi:peptide/nickel transport system substrate-binding protein
LHFHLRLNMKRKPFDDLRVRQAISYALDRDEILAGMDFGRGVMSSPMPATGNWDLPEPELRKLPGYGKDKKQIEADRTKAKQLLAAAGHPNGFNSNLMLGEGPVFDQGGIIAANQLKEIGIELSLQQEELTVHLNRTDKGDFDASAYELGISIDDPDDAFNVQFKTGAGRNYVGFTDLDVDRLIDQQTVTLDRAKRKEIVLDINRRLIDQVANVFIQWPMQNWTWQPHVKNFASKSGLYSAYRQTWVWMDKK